MLPLQITMKEMTPAIEFHLREKAEKLSQYYDRISSIRVVVDFTQKHKHQGKLYGVRIDITVPGKELVVTHKQNENLYIAIRNAFTAMTRQLEEYSRRRHGHVKTHNDKKHGYVARLMLRDGYGFIDGDDGNEYYFSVTNVSYPSFNQLLVGDEVLYQGEAFNDGQQAHHIVRERRNHREATY